MGKGDIKTKKGKIANGSYGVSRPKNSGAVPVKASEPVAKTKKSTKK